MKKLSEQNNFTYLFFSLVIFLFAAAVVVEYPSTLADDIFSIVTLVMLIVSIKSLKTEKTWKWAVYFLSVVFILFVVLGKLFGSQDYIYFNLVVLLIFFIGSFRSAFSQVLAMGDIDFNKIIGSISLYFILGLIWAVIYLLILAMDPSAFSGIDVTSWQQGFSRVAYYSFVTLTTLGYGDILPTNHIAEFFVYMEAIVGVFYMAIIVASLINSHDPKAKKKSDSH